MKEEKNLNKSAIIFTALMLYLIIILGIGASLVFDDINHYGINVDAKENRFINTAFYYEIDGDKYQVIHDSKADIVYIRYKNDMEMLMKDSTTPYTWKEFSEIERGNKNAYKNI